MPDGLTRREFVKGAALTAGALSSFGGGFLMPASAAESIKRGGVWKYARNRTPPGMDAHRASEFFTCMNAMCDCLVDVAIDPKTLELKLVPGLATDWQVDKTSKRLVFNLRKGVEFHDGSKFNAAAAKWSLDRVRSHPKS